MESISTTLVSKQFHPVTQTASPEPHAYTSLKDIEDAYISGKIEPKDFSKAYDTYYKSLTPEAQLQELVSFDPKRLDNFLMSRQEEARIGDTWQVAYYLMFIGKRLSDKEKDSSLITHEIQYSVWRYCFEYCDALVTALTKYEEKAGKKHEAYPVVIQMRDAAKRATRLHLEMASQEEELCSINDVLSELKC